MPQDDLTVTGAAAPQGDTLPLTVSRAELLQDGSDRKFRSLVHALFGFLVRHEAIRAGHGERIGLAGIEYTVLIAISHLNAQNEPVGVNQLAQHLHLSGAFVTTLTAKLMKRGLLIKAQDANDRRKVQLSVTQEGRDLLASLAPIQRRVNDVQFDAIKEGDLDMLLDLTHKLIDGSNRALKLQEYLKDHPIDDLP